MSTTTEDQLVSGGDALASTSHPNLYQCGKCSQTYKRIDHLSRHVRTRRFFRDAAILTYLQSTDGVKILKRSRINAMFAPRDSVECQSTVIRIDWPCDTNVQ